MSQPMVTIVSVEYRTREALIEASRAWQDAMQGVLPAEIVFVRNGVRPLDRLDPIDGVDIIENQRNLGFATAFNQGLAKANGQIVISCNLDVGLTAELIVTALRELNAHPASIVGPAMYNDHASTGRRRFYSPWSLVLARSPFREYWSRAPSGTPGWIIGAFMAARKEHWLDLRGFDERYFLYFEDVDLCWRAWERGLEVRLLDELPTFHAHGRASRRIGRVLLAHLGSACTFFCTHPRALLGYGPRIFGGRV